MNGWLFCAKKSTDFLHKKSFAFLRVLKIRPSMDRVAYKPRPLGRGATRSTEFYDADFHKMAWETIQ